MENSNLAQCVEDLVHSYAGRSRDDVVSRLQSSCLDYLPTQIWTVAARDWDSQSAIDFFELIGVHLGNADSLANATALIEAILTTLDQFQGRTTKVDRVTSRSIVRMRVMPLQFGKDDASFTNWSFLE